MNSTSQDPQNLIQAQNPFASCFVQASAGSGKTYQLSHRFFNLVMAGNDPASILCLTFSKAAVAEMHERILRLSHEFLRSETLQHEHSKVFKNFLEEQKKTNPKHALTNNLTFRSPRESAERILARSGSLRITTIDSLSWEWVRRFSTELQLQDFETSSRKKLQIETSSILDEEQKRILFSCIRDLLKSDAFKSYSWIQKKFKDHGFVIFAKTLEKLIQNFRPQCEHIHFASGSVANAFKRWDLDHEFNSETEIEDYYATLCSEILAPIATEFDEKKSSFIFKFLKEKKFDYLFSGKIFSKSELRISQINRKAILEEFSLQFEEISFYLKKHNEQLQFFRLNQEIIFFASCVHLFLSKWDEYQKENLKLSFSDLAPKSARLFLDPQFEHIRYLISQDIQHLLLDEFQDTSRLQWDIYQNLCQLILDRNQDSGFSKGSNPSIFLVGDSKQSIYAFRGADPSVSFDAKNFFESKNLLCVKMNISFRSSPRVLEYVNQLFSKRLLDFENHSTVDCQPGTTTDPDAGNISLLKASFDDFSLEVDERNKITVEEQNLAIADSLAIYLKHVLTHECERFPVWDKSISKWRSIRPEDCAILYRWSTHASIYEQAFRSVGININHIGNSFLKDHIVFKDCIALLRAHVLENDSLSLVSVLQSPFYKISHQDLLKALAELRGEYKSLNLDETHKHQTKTKLIGYLKKSNPRHIEIFEQHGKLFNQQNFSKIFLCLWREFDLQTSYLNDFTPQQQQPIQQLLVKFLDIMMELEKNTPGIQGVHLIEKLEQYAEEVQVENSSANSDAVTMMTVHASKGLEFPFVAVCNIENDWSKDEGNWCTDPEDPYKICYQGSSEQRPKFSKVFDRFSESLEQQKNQDGLRALYVALTRAKHHLCLAYSGLEKSATPITQSALTALGSCEERTFTFGILHASYGNPCESLNNHIISSKKGVSTHPFPDVYSSHEWTSYKKTDLLDVYAERIVLSSNQKHKLHLDNEFDEIKKEKKLNSAIKFSGSDYGTLLHKCLEIQLKTDPNGSSKFDFYKLKQIYFSLNNRKKLSFDLDQSLFQEISKSMASMYKSNEWQKLQKSYPKLKMEQEVQVLIDNELILLKIDLLMINALNQSVIVDWKSGQLPTENYQDQKISDEALLEYSRSLSYIRQIQFYHDAVHEIYPVQECWIYFSRYNRWLRVK